MQLVLLLPEEIFDCSTELKVRVSQHKGISFRTGNMLDSVEQSKILDHSLNSGHCTSDNNFKILDSCQPFDLIILESI